MLYICGVLFLAMSAAGEGSCPAGAGGATCRSAAEAPRTAVKPRPRADLITQELQELAAMKQLAEERIALLQEMKQTLNSGIDISIPEAHHRVLKEPLPLMSAIIRDDDKTPTGSADDYLVTKVALQFEKEKPVSFVKFLPLPRIGSAPSTLASAFLVTVQLDGRVRLFTPTGEMVLAFEAGHDEPVTQVVTSLAVKHSQEDAFITTADAGGTIRVHRVDARLRRATKDGKNRSASEEKVSQYLSSRSNVTTQFLAEMKVGPASNGEPPVITALAVASQQGARYFVAGDTEGRVTVFGRNGTLIETLDAGLTPGAKVEGLSSQLGKLLFHVGSDWGFINLERLEVQHMDCPEFEGRIASAVIDSQKATRVLVADEDGAIWVFSVKQTGQKKVKSTCTVEHRFQKGMTGRPLELASIQGYALTFEAGAGRDVSSISAISMAQVDRRKDASSSAITWHSERPAARDWAVHKRQQQGDLLALLSEDGLQVEILELLNMQVTSVDRGGGLSADSFGDFKMPVIGLAVVLVLGYQYMKQKNKGGGGGGFGGKKKDWDSAEFASLKSKISAKKAAKARGE